MKAAAAPRVRFRVAMVCSSLALACGSSLPGPPREQPPAAAFSQVPSPPPPAQVELVPARPSPTAVWVDGSYEWTGVRWRWADGGWFERPAAGVAYSDWALRRAPGATLAFAGAAWRDADGGVVPGPKRLASSSIRPEATEDVSADAGAAVVRNAPSPAAEGDASTGASDGGVDATP